MLHNVLGKKSLETSDFTDVEQCFFEKSPESSDEKYHLELVILSNYFQTLYNISDNI